MAKRQIHAWAVVDQKGIIEDSFNNAKDAKDAVPHLNKNYPGYRHRVVELREVKRKR